MTVLLWIGIGIFVVSVVAVNAARTPPAANIGMMGAVVGFVLMAADGVWAITRWLMG